jgi:DNA/RNA-binding domain of Phe-tRNA-synthetase-like protein
MVSWTMAMQLPVQLVVAEIGNIRVGKDVTAFDHLTACAGRYADLYHEMCIADVPGVQNARQFFRAIGIDPTKRRPSSEALLNRVLKNKEIYSVNTLVDVGNWCSLDFLLPTCIYDADKIHGDVAVRLGRKGESYLSLNHREINFENRFVLVDVAGPFGSPMTDSLRTAVQLGTKNAILGIWAPASYDAEELRKNGELFAERVMEYCGGRCEQIEIL